MIREPKSSNIDNISMTVILKNGQRFVRKDLPSNPTGDHEKIISFWEGNDVIVYPLDQVEKIIYHFDG